MIDNLFNPIPSKIGMYDTQYFKSYPDKEWYEKLDWLLVNLIHNHTVIHKNR